MLDNHRLVHSTFKAVLRPSASKKPPKPHLNVADLGNIEVRRNLISTIDSEFDSITISGDMLDDNQANLDVEELWSSMIDSSNYPPKKFWVSPREITRTGLMNWQKRSFPSSHKKMQHSRPI